MCGHFNGAKSENCENCKEPRNKPTSKKGYLTEIAQPLEDIKLPNVNKLIEFCENNGKDIAFCRREYYNSIAEMFILKGVKKEVFIKNKLNGNLNHKIRKFAIKDYFTIQASNLDGQ